MNRILAFVLLAMTAGAASPDTYSGMGLYIGSKTKDTRSDAQKLLDARAPTNAPKAAKPVLPPEIREVGGVRYHVEVLREWYRFPKGPQPLPAWTRVDGTVRTVRRDVVLMDMERGTDGLILRKQVVAVLNWPGRAVVDQHCGVFAMQLREPYLDPVSGQPIAQFDAGKPVSVRANK